MKLLTDPSVLRNIVAESTTKKAILSKFGLAPIRDNYKKLDYAIRKFQIDMTHIERCLPPISGGVRYQLETILVQNSTYQNRTRLKIRLIKSGLLKKACDECDNEGTWQGRPLSLQLDHKNGDSGDNRIENLRLLCPNCHSQTETYAGKNTPKKVTN